MSRVIIYKINKQKYKKLTERILDIDKHCQTERKTIMMNKRMKCDALKNKIMSAEEAAALFKNGEKISVPHFVNFDYPTSILDALADRVLKNSEELKFEIITGSGMPKDIEQRFAEAGIVAKYMIFGSGDQQMRKCINTPDSIDFMDIYVGEWGQNARYGFYGDIDYCVASVSAIEEDGKILPSLDIGNIPSMLRIAKKVLLEINVQSPRDFYKLCDIYVPEDPPNRKPIEICRVSDRIGTNYMECDLNKIVGIVIKDHPIDLVGGAASTGTPPPEIQACCDYFVSFIEKEVAAGKMPKNLLPFEVGIGAITDLVMRDLGEEFPGVTMYSEGISAAAQQLLEDRKLAFVSVCGVWSSPTLERIAAEPEAYLDRIVIRPSEISNNPEVIRRIGVIAINNILEADIYGNVNSTNVMGTRMLGGVGGSCDFSRSAYLSVFFTLSTKKNGKISSIVPFCSHIDHTEHDTDVVVTEYGVADLRYCSPRERVERMIAIAHPDYRDMLRDYYERSCKACGSGNAHTPHILSEAFSWYERAKKTGSMKVE